ncbi:hypothetical protein HPP92_028213 [Vanilla planifolia]|uniref:Uncharacterized protein n=1 Tax=Vanilla planifolia TaxID=51239 RepID=A0A835P8Q4_VANPL|nr:hypothetical protein HPP92_028213 [Vanilla planifolia]
MAATPAAEQGSRDGGIKTNIPISAECGCGIGENGFRRSENRGRNRAFGLGHSRSRRWRRGRTTSRLSTSKAPPPSSTSPISPRLFRGRFLSPRDVQAAAAMAAAMEPAAPAKVSPASPPSSDDLGEIVELPRLDAGFLETAACEFVFHETVDWWPSPWIDTADNPILPSDFLWPHDNADARCGDE